MGKSRSLIREIHCGAVLLSYGGRASAASSAVSCGVSVILQQIPRNSVQISRTTNKPPMSDSKSEYRVFALQGLPPGLLGIQSFAVATASELDQGKFAGEFFVLIQCPEENLTSGKVTFEIGDLPPELGSFDIEEVLNEVFNQIQVETARILERRASDLSNRELAYHTFNYVPGATSILSAWMRGIFTNQIEFIQSQTKCQKLRHYLELVFKSKPGSLIRIN